MLAAPASHPCFLPACCPSHALQIVLLGVCCSRGAGGNGDECEEVTLQPLPLYSVPADNVTMVTVSSSADGRIFLGGAGALRAVVVPPACLVSVLCGAACAVFLPCVKPPSLPLTLFCVLFLLGLLPPICRWAPVRAAVRKQRQLALQALPQGRASVLLLR